MTLTRDQLRDQIAAIISDKCWQNIDDIMEGEVDAADAILELLMPINAQSADRSAWLCELKGAIPSYFLFDCDQDFTTDHNAALQLATKEAAEQVIAWFGWTEVKAVEHMWTAPKIDQQEESGT